MANIKLAIDELHRAFKLINQHLFEDSLPEPAILIQNNGKRKGVMGWCTTKPIWSDKENKIKKYEITICAEFLNSPIDEILGTMLHEMVHLDNAIKGIQDCSRGGHYHNKKFKETAEAKGLIVEYADKMGGWTNDKPSDETLKLFKSFNINQDAFKIARRGAGAGAGAEAGEENEEGNEGDGEKDGGEKKSHIRKYVCPNPECPEKTLIRASKAVNVMCGECMLTLIEAE